MTEGASTPEATTEIDDADATGGQRRARVPRRWFVIALLVLTAVTFGVLGVQAEQRGSTVIATEHLTGGRVTTPVLSARRVPTMLVRPQAQHRLQAAMSPLLGTSTPTRCVMVSDGATPLISDQVDTPLAVASNQKLLTAIAAIDALGADSKLTTTLAAASAPVNGVVNGDLWFIGGGDPVIDTDTYQSTLRYGKTPHTSLEAIADQVKTAGITSITGSIRGDEHRYDSIRAVATWPARITAQNQVGPLSAMAVNDSRAYPAIGPITGTIRPAPDPPAYAAQALTALLAARGIAVVGPPGSGVAPAGLTDVLRVDSLSVKDILGEMLTNSDNTTAESLVKEIGLAKRKEGSTTAGIAAIVDLLNARSLPTNGVVVHDGSGLDGDDRATCRLLDGILRADRPNGPIASGLPIAGKTGTLRDRYSKSPAIGLVRAKTGTLRNVSTLSGWVHTTKGADVSFTVALNLDRNVDATDLRFEEHISEALLAYPDTIDLATVSPLASTR